MLCFYECFLKGRCLIYLSMTPNASNTVAGSSPQSPPISLHSYTKEIQLSGRTRPEGISIIANISTKSAANY